MYYDSCNWEYFAALNTLKPHFEAGKLQLTCQMNCCQAVDVKVMTESLPSAFTILTWQIFKGTFHFCEGNNHVKNKEECLNSSDGRWENHMYNFDNLPKVNN